MEVDTIQMHIYICASYEIYICRFLCAKLAFGFGRVSLFVPTIPSIRKRVYFTASMYSYKCMLVYSLLNHIVILYYVHILLCIQYIYTQILRIYIYTYIYARCIQWHSMSYVHTRGHVLLLLYAISTFIFGLSCDCLSRS